MFNTPWEPFSRPSNLFGFNVIIEEPKLVPKLKLSDTVPVTEEFRVEMNQWLLDMFGTKDESIIPVGTAYVFGGTVLMRPEMLAGLSSV